MAMRELSNLSRTSNTSVHQEDNKQDNPIVNKIDTRLLINLKDLSLFPTPISEGSTSIVYQGLYKKIPVAVKIIEALNPETQVNFVREVMMLSGVKHDNLVKFIGASMEPKLMIVMELMKGGSLQKFLADMRPRTPDLQTSISFALDIARVMECLHSNGIIHRDLKPSNLLLTENQKKVKLADFGLAREETVNEMMSSEVGTYRWMAPELYSTVPLRRGEKKHYDHKVDIYSFSIVLWELLTNSTPFKGMTNIQAAYAASKKQRPSLDNFPPDLVPLVESCWDEDPASRPEFEEIGTTLSNFLESQHLTQNPSTPKNVNEQRNFDVTDSPGTRHLMDKSGDLDGKKSRSSSPKIFRGCFDKCFMT